MIVVRSLEIQETGAQTASRSVKLPNLVIGHDYDSTSEYALTSGFYAGPFLIRYANHGNGNLQMAFSFILPRKAQISNPVEPS